MLNLFVLLFLLTPCLVVAFLHVWSESQLKKIHTESVTKTNLFIIVEANIVLELVGEKEVNTRITRYDNGNEKNRLVSSQN